MGEQPDTQCPQNIVRRLPIEGNRQIGLHACSVTANVVDGAPAPQWFEDSGDTPDWERQVVSLASAARIIEVRLPRDYFMPDDKATWRMW